MLVPVLTVKDLKASLTFYQQLGFIQDWQWQSTTQLHYDDLLVYLKQAPVSQQTLYWYVADVYARAADLSTCLSAINVTMTPVEQQPWGNHETTFIDPDGHRWVIATPSRELTRIKSADK